MKKIYKILIFILIIAMFFCIIPKRKYAAENVMKIGDINGDEIVDSRDTLRILEHIAASTIPQINQKHSDWILTGNRFKAADINEDKIIDSIDTLRELEYIAASTVPTINQKHPNWKAYIENKRGLEVTGISLDKTKIIIEKGKISKLFATITPVKATNKIVTWSSSDQKVAIVDGIGNIEAKNVGITIITATTQNKLCAKCEVKVIDNATPKVEKSTQNQPSTTLSNLTRNISVEVKSTGITIRQKDCTLAVGKSLQLNATIQPANTTNKTVTWISSDNSKATIDKYGIVKGIKPGKVTITARTSNNHIATCLIRVNIPLNSISLNKNNITIDKGKKYKFTLVFKPSNATDKTITWYSSNTKVATITKSGEINAKSVGITYITAISKNGKSTQCKVKVEDNKKAEKVIKVMKEWQNMSSSKVHKEVYTYYNATNPKYKMKWDSQWCSETVSAAFAKAGMVDLIGGVSSHTGSSNKDTQSYYKNFNKMGIKKSKNSTPKPGWIVCYGSGTGHTALVIGVSGNKIKALAGARSGNHGVGETSISKSSVRFYGAPKFSN